ncbi:MAG TPA: F-box protein [Candidatus Babeliales bacterium]|nr:F-box protein [Candidatus Babeliales bacterium]
MKSTWFFLTIFLSTPLIGMKSISSIDEILNVIFSYLDYKSRHCLRLTNKKYYNFCEKNEAILTLDTNHFIDHLFLYKDNQEDFNFLINNATSDNKKIVGIYTKYTDITLWGDSNNNLFDLWRTKTKVDNRFKLKEDTKNSVKFYFPYTKVRAYIDSLSKDKTNTQAIFEEIEEQICKFFITTGLKEYEKNILQNFNSQKKNIKKNYLQKALEQSCFPAIVLLLHKMKHSDDYWDLANNNESRRLLIKAGYYFKYKKIGYSYLLESAIKAKKIDPAKSLISILVESDNRECMDVYDQNKKNPITLALEAGTDEILEKLIAVGAELSVPRYNLDSFATESNIQKLIECGCDVNKSIYCKNNMDERYPPVTSFLRETVKENNTELVKLLLQEGAKIDCEVIMASLNNPAILDILLEQKPQLDFEKEIFSSQRSTGDITNAPEESIMKLIKNGYFENCNLEKILNAATKSDKSKVVRWILSQDNYPLIESVDLYNSIVNNHSGIVKIILTADSKKCNHKLLNTKVLEGAHDFMAITCVNQENTEMLNILFNAGTNILDRDRINHYDEKNNHFPYYYLVKHSDENAVIRSLKMNKKINKKRHEEYTSLFYSALYNKKIELTKFLLFPVVSNVVDSNEVKKYDRHNILPNILKEILKKPSKVFPPVLLGGDRNKSKSINVDLQPNYDQIMSKNYTDTVNCTYGQFIQHETNAFLHR